MTVDYQYLPPFPTIDEATDWAAERGLVAWIEGRGPDGLYRGLAVEPDVASAALEGRAKEMQVIAEAMAKLPGEPG